MSPRLKQESRLSGREFKNAIFQELARMGKALGNGHRLEIIDLLCQGEKTVEELARETGRSVAATSSHLQSLKTARIATSRKNGLHVHYRLLEGVPFLYKSLEATAKRNIAEIQRLKEEFFSPEEDFTGLNSSELLKKARAGEIILLDVRPEPEYRAGHLPGAISMPLGKLRSRDFAGKKLPRRKPILAYCRGPYCVLSREAVFILKNIGFRAFRLAEGVVEWRQDGVIS